MPCGLDRTCDLLVLLCAAPNIVQAGKVQQHTERPQDMRSVCSADLVTCYEPKTAAQAAGFGAGGSLRRMLVPTTLREPLVLPEAPVSIYNLF